MEVIALPTAAVTTACLGPIVAGQETRSAAVLVSLNFVLNEWADKWMHGRRRCMTFLMGV